MANFRKLILFLVNIFKKGCVLWCQIEGSNKMSQTEQNIKVDGMQTNKAIALLKL